MKILIDENLIKTKYKYDNEWELIENVKKLYKDGSNYSSIGKIFNIKQYKNKIKNGKISLKKLLLINKIRKMYEHGASKSSIAREFEIDFKIVISYIDESIFAKKRLGNRKKLIDSFKLDIIEFFTKNEKKEYISNILKEREYNQSFRTFRYYFPQIIKETYENQGLENKKIYYKN